MGLNFKIFFVIFVITHWGSRRLEDSSIVRVPGGRGREREGAVGHGQRAVDSVQWTVCSWQLAVVDSGPW